MPKETKTEGQSFVELALSLPILILMIAGMLEVVFAYDSYMNMLDGSRNGARRYADVSPIPFDSSFYYNTTTTCADTSYFFRHLACDTDVFLTPIDVLREYEEGAAMPTTTDAFVECVDQTVEPDNFRNDVVISIFTTAVVTVSGSQEFEVKRFDDNRWITGSNPYLVEDDGTGDDTDTAESGWSYLRDQYKNASDPSLKARGMCSAISTAQISSLLLGSGGVAEAAPNNAYLLVEVFFRHYQLFDAPVFGDVIGNPIKLHAYSIFSVSGAEATSTPEP